MKLIREPLTWAAIGMFILLMAAFAVLYLKESP